MILAIFRIFWVLGYFVFICIQWHFSPTFSDHIRLGLCLSLYSYSAILRGPLTQNPQAIHTIHRSQARRTNSSRPEVPPDESWGPEDLFYSSRLEYFRKVFSSIFKYFDTGRAVGGPVSARCRLKDSEIVCYHTATLNSYCYHTATFNCYHTVTTNSNCYWCQIVFFYTACQIVPQHGRC